MFKIIESFSINLGNFGYTVVTTTHSNFLLSDLGCSREYLLAWHAGMWNRKKIYCMLKTKIVVKSQSIKQTRMSRNTMVLLLLISNTIYLLHTQKSLCCQVFCDSTIVSSTL